jgi:NADH dehydrogenase
MTSQRAQRQTKQVARNVTASLGIGRAEPYKHHGLGFLVGLAGRAVAASPSTCRSRVRQQTPRLVAYHLRAMSGNRAGFSASGP